VSIASRGRESDGGDLEWESARRGWEVGKAARLAGIRASRAISYVDEDEGAGTGCRCEPKNDADPQIAMGAAIGATCGDALSRASRKDCEGSIS
jgi:hypothetical protein